MTKFLLVNWTSGKETRGGCETLFDELNSLLRDMGHETKMVTFNHAKKTLGIGLERERMGFFEAEASHVIDRYCSHYTKLFPDTKIISNAGITNFWYKNPNTTNIFNDPYKAIVNKLLRLGIFGATHYNKYGNMLVRMQQESAKGANNIAISDFMAGEMWSMGVKPDKTIPHGIDLNIFRPWGSPLLYNDLRQRFDLPKDAKVAVWSKDFNPVAGFHIISHLVDKFPDIYWLLQFKNKVDYKPRNSNVRILQPRDRYDMRSVFCAADFCVNPSVTESFGLVPLEAMSCGIPTILSNTGFVWEKNMKNDFEKRDYGMLVNSWNPKAFEKAVGEFLDGGSYKPRKFAEQFSKKKWKKNWKDYIDKLCETKNTSKSR